jgi:hypothetical protein
MTVLIRTLVGPMQGELEFCTCCAVIANATLTQDSKVSRSYREISRTNVRVISSTDRRKSIHFYMFM